MKVLLIAPPGKETIKSDLIHLIHEERGINPPIGLLYIATSIKKEHPEYPMQRCYQIAMGKLGPEKAVKKSHRLKRKKK